MVIRVKDKSGNVVRIIKTEDYKNTVVSGFYASDRKYAEKIAAKAQSLRLQKYDK